MRRVLAALLLLFSGCARDFSALQNEQWLLLFLWAVPMAPCGTLGPGQTVNLGTTATLSRAFTSIGILESSQQFPALTGCTPAAFSSSGSKSVSGSFSYGFRGVLTSYTINGLQGGVAYNIMQMPWHVSFPCGNISAGLGSLTIGYDALDRIVSTTSSIPASCTSPGVPASAGSFTSTISYSSSLPLLASSSTTATTGTNTFTYTTNGALVTQVSTAQTTPASTRNEVFTYSGPNITSIACTTTSGANSCAGGAANSTTNYTYDSAGRLTQISVGAATITFTYDSIGRITQWTGPFGGASTIYTFYY